MTATFEWMFWISFGFCAYTFIGYVVCLQVLGICSRRERLRNAIEPTVSILIAVRDAETLIEAKLRNCLAVDYPKDKMEIIVACDGPSLATEQITTSSFAAPRVRCITVPARGKTAALGAALENSSGEIVVFTDVSVMLDRHGISAIVSNFADPKVGCVSSEDVTAGAAGNAEPLYVLFDRYVRRLESRVGTLIGVSGSFFAARRSVCARWDMEMTSDFFVPLRTIEAGLDVVVDPDARGYLSSGDPGREFERKVRTLVNGFHVLFCHWHLLNPFAHRVAAWELVSRKLFRWLLPIAFFALLLSNCMLAISSTLFRWALASQFVVYATGTLALLANPVRKILPFKLAGFFVMGNAATVTAWWKFLGGERYVSWKPTRRQEVADRDAMRATDH